MACVAVAAKKMRELKKLRNDLCAALILALELQMKKMEL